MPVNRFYTVTQTREVEVSASELVDAIRIADAYFNDKPKPNLEYARVMSSIREVDLAARENSR